MSFDKKDLVELLMRERDHHFRHPATVTSKAFFTLVTVLTTTLAGAFTLQFGDNPVPRWALMVGFAPVVAGFCILVLGVVENQEYHATRREGLERLIQNVIGREPLKPEDILQGKFHPDAEDQKQYSGNALEHLKLAFVAEPDLRKRRHHHDTKILFGVILCFLGPALWFVSRWY